MEKAVFLECEFKNCKTASLKNVTFNDCMVDLSGFETVEKCEFNGCKILNELNGIKIIKSDFFKTDVKINGCELFKAQFWDVLFEDVKFENIKNSILDGSEFKKCKFQNLEIVSFYKSKIDSCEFNGIKLSKVSFDKAKIKNTEYVGSLIEACGFEQSEMENVFFDDSVLLRNRFNKAVLKEIDFTKVKSMEHSRFYDTLMYNIKGAKSIQKEIVWDIDDSLVGLEG
jgi:uncharacterized protein YjbI with pentapeptide repeats